MATEPYVLDATVIINLACVSSATREKVVGALETRALVAMEVDEELLVGVKSIRQHPHARAARAVGLRMNQGPEDDRALIERGDELREAIAKPSDPPDKHLGEAGSAALAEQLSSTLITDDGAGRDLERLTGVALLNTAGLLRELVTRGLLACGDARKAYAEMIEAKRWIDPDEIIC